MDECDRDKRAYGVFIGIVVDNKDPQGMARVKVKLPSRSNSETDYWARISSFMGGNQRGAFFLPEVGDEVLIAFEAGDLIRPYILGALWNGKDAPPDINADGKNNIRFIKSRSGHIVRLDDTDGAEKIEIIDKSGQSSITIDASAKTVVIKSNQDISIEAPSGCIKLTAKNIELNSSAATNVKAQGGLNLDGSPGTTALKGTTVNIN